ncbi:hypothetical protein ABIA14_006698 [Sinorhizobium fredii]|nr:hypothetical protein [Sinorhizobium fredii]GEC33249.1 hypothetical protein EFR01_34200 [Sinorhizobium fredii]GLS08311.1 hypothetical protein GCM10007864_19400 [Sinorhizobium fredii]
MPSFFRLAVEGFYPASQNGWREMDFKIFRSSPPRPTRGDSVSLGEGWGTGRDTCHHQHCNFRFLDDHRVLVEPGCSAAHAVAYSHGEQLARYERVLIVVRGGSTASVNQLQACERPDDLSTQPRR